MYAADRALESASGALEGLDPELAGVFIGAGAGGARGATIYGEIMSYRLTNDARHITQPSVEVQTATMQAALRSAGLAAEAIDAINAHGTGTKANDSTETAAIRAVFGKHADAVPVSATKAIHGHLLGALETLLSLLAMRHDAGLPTMHLAHPDPDCDLDSVAGGLRTEAGVRTMLTNSFAFGGTNAMLALGAV